MDKQQPAIIRSIVTDFFVCMLLVNVLAEAIPFNGYTMRGILNAYENLFTPLSFTFMIVMPVYLLLALFILYQWGAFLKNDWEKNLPPLGIQIAFAISCLANMGCLISFHAFSIPLSIVFMAFLFGSICFVYVRNARMDFWKKEFWLLRAPFSAYFGLITFLSILNITVLLVSLHWDRLGLFANVWTIIAIAIGLAVAIPVIIKNRDAVYGAVFLWCYAGLLAQHLARRGFAGAYPEIGFTLILAIIVLAGAILIALMGQRRNRYTEQ